MHFPADTSWIPLHRDICMESPPRQIMTRPNDSKRNGAMPTWPRKGRDKEGERRSRAVQCAMREGRDDAIMMTLALSVLQMSKSLTYISCTLITLACPQEGPAATAAVLASWRRRLAGASNAPDKIRFMPRAAKEQCTGGREGRKARPNEHTPSGIGMNREAVFGFRNSPWLLICIPIGFQTRSWRADSPRPDSRFSFTVNLRASSLPDCRLSSERIRG